MGSRNEKFLYIWRLARFLHENKTNMSGQELADHLNRNGIKTSYGTQYEGGRGTYKLISSVWNWVEKDLGLHDEAEMIARAFVNPDNLYAYDE